MKHFFKSQTKWAWVPAAVDSHVCRNVIHLRVRPGYTLDPDALLRDKVCIPSMITLTEHEAMSLAAFLSEASEKIVANKRKAAERRAVAAAKRAAKRKEVR